MDQKTRSERIEARTTPDVLAVVKRAAEMQGRSISEFVITAAEREAQRTIEHSQIVRLSAEDQLRLAEALLNPAPPAPAMQRAFEHHTRLVGGSE